MRYVSDEYTCTINGKDLSFYHNTKTHRYEVLVDYEISPSFDVSKAKGEAIIEFLKFILGNEGDIGL